MTVSLEDFDGFESGGMEGSQAIGTATDAVTSPAPVSSKETYVGRIPWKGTFSCQEVTQGTKYITVGWYWRCTDASPATDNRVWSCEDGSGGGINFSVELETSGDLVLSNAFTMISGVVVDTWYRIEFKFNIDSSGEVQVWVDGTQVVDTTGNTDLRTNATIQMKWENSIDEGNHYVSSYYVISDDGAAITTNDTRLNDFEILVWYDGNASTTSDWDTGDSLNGGTWANMAAVPVNDSNTGHYALTTAGSSKEGGVSTNATKAGPLGDTDIDGTLSGYKWIWRAKKSAAANIQFYGKWGLTDSQDPDNDNTTTTSSFGNLTTSFQNFYFVTESTSTADYGQIGFKGDQTLGFASRNCIVSGMWMCGLFASSSGRFAIIQGKRLLVN